MNYKVFTTILLLSLGITKVTNSQETTVMGITAVEKHGQLSIQGRYLMNQYNEPVVLRGMSLFWSQWGGEYFNKHCIKWLATDWKCSIIRAPLGVDHNGYLARPNRELKKINKAVKGAIDAGIYIIIDWHDHHAHHHTEQAVGFFKTIAQKYGHHPNIIYEIYNEPLITSWSDTVKPYAESVIKAIREYDPDNIIIVGTTQYSQNVEEIIQDPLTFSNVAYTLHFYSGTHQQWLRDKAQLAIDNNIPLFVSEWGGSDSHAKGEFQYEETLLWLEFMAEYQLSWCTWSVFTKNETTSVLKNGAARRGNWNESDLTETGIYMRNLIRKLNTE